MKKNIFIFLAFFVSLFAVAQKVKVEGVVKDEAGNTLEMANVIAFQKGTNFLESYSITDSNGKYRLSLEESKAYTLKVNYLGFEPKVIEISIEISSADIVQDIVLKEASESLNEVEITYEIPIGLVQRTTTDPDKENGIELEDW